MSVRVHCPTCSNPVPAGSRACPSCGAPLPAASMLATNDLPPGDVGAEQPIASSSSASAEARFLPGFILAGRYRIVGLLGRGGMGEVYRADDLKLGQPVALKFLPRGFDRDPGRLRRFLDEARTARQIAHPSVCRTYDAGEADGQHFLSMEYVDGEDLASLLRRVGHLPKEKAIQVARQIAAGLAAAHATGVLHRDLKPANIMIDGRGRARITDFGLARLTGEVAGDEILAGTPAYMAPEQAAGREVTAKSDLYALGLVLYEMFTGRPAMRARSLDQRRRQPPEPPPPPSSFMDGFDPKVERIILRCLEEDPARRPPSAVAVAASLPGGDPLAAALAAGETPSPEMVAEAGGEGAVPPALAGGLLALGLASVAAVVVLAPWNYLIGMVSLDKPPEVLQERAREILKLAGHDAKRADSLDGFRPDADYLDALVRREGAGSGRWGALRSSPPAGVVFWYRESPRELVPTNAGEPYNGLADPPDDLPGMARVGLDPEGRLVALRIVPDERTLPPAAEPDWTPLLAATGVDVAGLVNATPEWTPPVFADRRVAWTASWPGRPGLPIRIEAASAGGRPVWLRLVMPWSRPAETPAPAAGFGARVAQVLKGTWPLVVLVVAASWAFRNVRRGRGDRRGALRLAIYLGAVRMTWLLGAHGAVSSAASNRLLMHLAQATLLMGVVYVFYLAIEPIARRVWPHLLVSWVRVLEGRFRDPRVGRDLLFGSAGGALSALINLLAIRVPEILGAAPSPPDWSVMTFDAIRGPLPFLVNVAVIHTLALREIFFPMTTLLLFRLLLRRSSLAILATSLVGVLLFIPGTGSIGAYLLASAIIFSIIWFVLLHAGLLGFATLFCVRALLDSMPVTLHPADWYAGSAILSLVVAVAPALYGFWIARAGRPLFGDAALEAEGSG